jgi:hypothetical protein
MRNARFMALVAPVVLLGSVLLLQVGPLAHPLAAAAVSAGSNRGGMVTNFGFGIDGPEGITSGPDGTTP